MTRWFIRNFMGLVARFVGGQAIARPREPWLSPRQSLSTPRATTSHAPIVESVDSSQSIPRKGSGSPSTRIIEWETAPNGKQRTLGRVVMVGKFSEICAELDRLAALEMA